MNITVLPPGYAWGYEPANSSFKRSSYHSRPELASKSMALIEVIKEQKSQAMNDFMRNEQRILTMIDTTQPKT